MVAFWSLCQFFTVLLTLTPSHQHNSAVHHPIFMDTLQAEVDSDLKEAQDQLVLEATAVRPATERYAKAKLTQNIFRALRVLAVKELEEIPLHLRMRQPRQDESDENSAIGGFGGDDEDTSDTGSSSDGASTTKRTVPLIPVLAGILKSVFGGGENSTGPGLNVTHTIQSATRLFFPLGLPFPPFSRRPTAPPATVIKYYPVAVYPTTQPTEPPPTKPTTTRPLRLVGRSHARRLRREAVPMVTPIPPTEIITTEHASTLAPAPLQNYAPAYLTHNQIPTVPPPSSVAPPMLVYAPGHRGGVYAPLHTKSVSTSTPLPPSPPLTTKPVRMHQVALPAFAEVVAEPSTTSGPTAATTSATTPSTTVGEGATVDEFSEGGSADLEIFSTTESRTPGLIYVDSLARDVQNGFDGLVKNLPEILKGAKEALGLLANIREIFGSEEDARK